MKYKGKRIDIWSHANCELNLSCIKPIAMSSPLIESCPKEGINSNVFKVYELDLHTVKDTSELCFSSAYELKIKRSDVVSGIISWFDVHFDNVPNKEEFSTSPFYNDTHWKQGVFYIENDLKVNKGDTLKGSFAALLRDNGNLDFKVSYHIPKGVKTASNNTPAKDFVQLYRLRPSRPKNLGA